jgi:NADH-quinone oxidoreductase subunit L
LAIAKRYPLAYRTLVNKYYIDEVYDAVVVDPTVKVSNEILWNGIDVIIIDGIVNGMAKLVASVAQSLRKIQTGVAQSYAVVFIGGILYVIAWLLLR